MSNSNTSGNDLEERLISFGVNIIVLSNKIHKNYTGNHLRHQLIRSGTSPALNYAEARFAESKKDFIHKVK
jgi:four helix bundle protein